MDFKPSKFAFAVFIAVIFAGCRQVTGAHWDNETDPLGFAENTISFIREGGYLLAFKCIEKNRLMMALTTDEFQDFNHRPAFWPGHEENEIVHFRVDNDPVKDLSAVTTWESDNRLIFLTNNSLETAEALKAAARAAQRIVVGAGPNVSGGRSHVVTFSVNGAMDVLGKTIAACKT